MKKQAIAVRVENRAKKGFLRALWSAIFPSKSAKPKERKSVKA